MAIYKQPRVRNSNVLCEKNIHSRCRRSDTNYFSCARTVRFVFQTNIFYVKVNFVNLYVVFCVEYFISSCHPYITFTARFKII